MGSASISAASLLLLNAVYDTGEQALEAPRRAAGRSIKRSVRVGRLLDRFGLGCHAAPICRSIPSMSEGRGPQRSDHRLVGRTT